MKITREQMLSFLWGVVYGEVFCIALWPENAHIWLAIMLLAGLNLLYFRED